MQKHAFERMVTDFPWLWAVSWEWHPAGCEIVAHTVKTADELQSFLTRYTGSSVHVVILDEKKGGGHVRPGDIESGKTALQRIYDLIYRLYGYPGHPIDYIVLHHIVTRKKNGKQRHITEYVILRPKREVDLFSAIRDMLGE